MSDTQATPNLATPNLATPNLAKPNLPRAIEDYLNRAAIAPVDSLLLSFDENWQWLGYVGDLVRFGLEQTSTEEISSLLKALCIGLPRVRGAALKHIGLPNGRFVDLHLFSSKSGVHVLLLDAREEVEKTRVWQQSAQETELKSYEKTRELRKQRSSLSEVRKERDALAWALALAQARYGQLRHELFATGAATEALAEVLERTERNAPLIRSAVTCNLEAVAQALEKLSVAQISLKCNRNDARPIAANPATCASALLPLLMFAHRRASLSTPELSATLQLENDTLRLSAYCGSTDLTASESGLAWERKLPASSYRSDEIGHDSTPSWLPSDLALVLCAQSQASMGARLTRQFDPALGLTLLLSVPLPKGLDTSFYENSAMAVPRTRVALAVGARCWLLSLDQALAQIAGTAVESRGLVLEQPIYVDGLLAQLLLRPPQVILIDPNLPDAAKFAFRARSAGFSGLIIALRPVTAGAAIKAAFDGICESMSASAISAVLFA